MSPRGLAICKIGEVGGTDGDFPFVLQHGDTSALVDMAIDVHRPKIIPINWFRATTIANFIWPAWGEPRILLWMLGGVAVRHAIRTPIGGCRRRQYTTGPAWIPAATPFRTCTRCTPRSGGGTGTEPAVPAQFGNAAHELGREAAREYGCAATNKRPPAGQRSLRGSIASGISATVASMNRWHRLLIGASRSRARGDGHVDGVAAIGTTSHHVQRRQQYVQRVQQLRISFSGQDFDRENCAARWMPKPA